MKSFLFVLILIPFSVFARDKIIITGSSTVAPVISDIAKAFEQNHREARIDVQTGGSSRGIADTRSGVANIGMVSRALKGKEKDLQAYTFAKDGLAIIVHSSNPVKELSQEQVQKIYRGEIKDWSEVGGPEGKIVVVNKAEGRSTLELFLKFFKLKNSQVKASIIIGDNEQGIKSVSTNSLAIGYVSIGAAEYNASVGVKIKLLPFQGVKAAVSNVENGSYPLVRDLNLITKGEKKKLVDDFIKFVLSKKSSELIKEHYFVPSN